MLPDIDADDGDVSEERILVGGGDHLKTLGGRVKSLHIAVNPTDPKSAKRKTHEPSPA